jgi:NTE family protein
MKNRLVGILIVVLSMFAVAMVQGQTVGLALSGGGSKGLAHIGVIRALEEQGIPIHYITGTSIGAIVGGLYAAGYSTDEMEKLFLDPKFELWVSGKLDEEYTYHFKQDSPNSMWLGFRFSVDSAQFSPTIPVNLRLPIQMDMAFLELFSGVDAIAKHNFDSLFVPFRCIGSDITHNREVVFRSGYLKDAIRASMTFPFYYRPISINKSLFYDGGMVNNFPTDVLYADFKPDYIIGVVVAKPNEVPSEENLISVLSNMLMAKENYTLKNAPAGIIIQPNVPNLTVTDFRNSAELIEIGYQTLLDSLPRIKDFVWDSIGQREIELRRKEFRAKIPAIVIDDIEIEGLNKLQSDYIKGIMIKPQEVLTLEMFKRQYFKLISEEYISHVYPYLSLNYGNRTYKATLTVTKEKAFKANIGGYISANAYTTLFLQFKYYYWKRQVVRVNADVYVGRYYNSIIGKLRLSRVKRNPFDQTISAGYSRWNYFNTYPIFIGSETPAYLVHEEAILDYRIMHLIKHSSRIVGNITLFSTIDRYYWDNLYTKQDSRDKNQAFLIRPSFFYEYSTIDFRYFATQGLRIRTEFAFFAGYEYNRPGTTSYQKVKSQHFRHWFSFNGEVEKLFRMGKVYRLGISGHLAWSNLPMFKSYNATKIRANQYAPTHESTMAFLPGYRDPVFMAGGLSNTFLLYKNLQFRLDGYFYQPVVSVLRDILNDAYQSIPFEKHAFIAYASLAYTTKLGPISVNLSWYSSNNPNLMFNMSFGYLFFINKIF